MLEINDEKYEKSLSHLLEWKFHMISIEIVFPRKFSTLGERINTDGNSIDFLPPQEKLQRRESWTNDSFLGELQASWIPS